MLSGREAEWTYAQQRETFAKRIAELESGLPESKRKGSYELASAKLEQLEFEIAVCFENGDKLSQPQKIAEAHSFLQQQIELLKRQNIALLPAISGAEDDSEGWKNYRLSKTKRSLAFSQLAKFETLHGLPNSQPRFAGKTLLGHLEVIETERDTAALGSAYLGAVNLSDQFETRGEFFDLLKKLIVEHGNTVGFQMRTPFQIAIETGIPKLTGDELETLTTDFLVREGDSKTMTTLQKLIRLRPLRSEFAAGISNRS